MSAVLPTIDPGLGMSTVIFLLFISSPVLFFFSKKEKKRRKITDEDKERGGGIKSRHQKGGSVFVLNRDEIELHDEESRDGEVEDFFIIPFVIVRVLGR